MGKVKEKLNGRTHLFSVSDMVPSFTESLEGQILIVSPKHMVENWTDEYLAPEFQLFKAIGGFGCKPGSLGSAVFGNFLEDGESCRMERFEILGVLKPELVAEYKLDELAIN
jgi:hypothetical protein